MFGAQHHLTPTQEAAIARSRAFHAKIAAQAVPDSGICLKAQRRVDPLVLTQEEVARQGQAPIQLVAAEPISLPLREPLWFGPALDEFDIPKGREPRVEEIQRCCTRYFEVKRVDLLGERRGRAIVRPRQIAIYLCRHFTTRSLPDIGRRFGGRDHTTALASIRRIEALCKTDKSIAYDVAHLEARFR